MFHRRQSGVQTWHVEDDECKRVQSERQRGLMAKGGTTHDHLLDCVQGEFALLLLRSRASSRDLEQLVAMKCRPAGRNQGV